MMAAGRNGAFPTTITALTGAAPKILELSSGITETANTLSNGTWTVTLAGGGTAVNTFTASPAAYASCTA